MEGSVAVAVRDILLVLGKVPVDLHLPGHQITQRLGRSTLHGVVDEVLFME